MIHPPPCLHRIHTGNPVGAHRIHHRFGMSIELDLLVERLARLDAAVERNAGTGRSQLVTFDDGWADVTLVAPNFERLLHLQPVLFLTADQCVGERALLPLPRLYGWYASTASDKDVLVDLESLRDQLKELPEAAQHARLDQLGVPRIHNSSEVLSRQAIERLMGQGWLVGSHGANHRDLRQSDLGELAGVLEHALGAVSAVGGLPWLAWPEGRCVDAMCEVARSVGFERQFGLCIESGALERPDLTHREIWK